MYNSYYQFLFNYLWFQTNSNEEVAGGSESVSTPTNVPEDGGEADNQDDDTKSKTKDPASENIDQADPSATNNANDDNKSDGGNNSLAQGEKHQWPAMQDLNTRLRRVITSYQRNYKKEEAKTQQKSKVC